MAKLTRLRHDRSGASARRVRVVVCGLGDTGLQVMLSLARHRDRVEVVGVSAKPGYLSGRHLGVRLARVRLWERDQRIDLDRFRRLDSVRTTHGLVPRSTWRLTKSRSD